MVGASTRREVHTSRSIHLAIMNKGIISRYLTKNIRNSPRTDDCKIIMLEFWIIYFYFCVPAVGRLVDGLGL